MSTEYDSDYVKFRDDNWNVMPTETRLSLLFIADELAAANLEVIPFRNFIRPHGMTIFKTVGAGQQRRTLYLGYITYHPGRAVIDYTIIQDNPERDPSIISLFLGDPAWLPTLHTAINSCLRRKYKLNGQ